MLLERVENGYGGSVAFGYEEKLLDNAPYPNCQNDSQRWAVNSAARGRRAGQRGHQRDRLPGARRGDRPVLGRDLRVPGLSPVIETLYPVGQSSGAAARLTSSHFHQLADGSWTRPTSARASCSGRPSAMVRPPCRPPIGCGRRPATGRGLGPDRRYAGRGGAADNLQLRRLRQHHPRPASTSPTTGSLSLYRTTVTTYGHLLSGGRYIVDRPKAQRVFAGGETGACARTEYNYGGGYGASPVTRQPAGAATAHRQLQRRQLRGDTLRLCQRERQRRGQRQRDQRGGGERQPGSEHRETRTSYYPPGIDVQSVTRENGANDLVTSYSYDAYGQLGRRPQPNSLRQRISYDPFGRLCQVERRFIGSSAWTAQTRWAYSDTGGGGRGLS